MATFSSLMAVLSACKAAVALFFNVTDYITGKRKNPPRCYRRRQNDTSFVWFCGVVNFVVFTRTYSVLNGNSWVSGMALANGWEGAHLPTLGKRPSILLLIMNYQ